MHRQRQLQLSRILSMSVNAIVKGLDTHWILIVLHITHVHQQIREHRQPGADALTEATLHWVQH